MRRARVQRILKVDSCLLIDKVFKRIGIEHFNVNTLLDKTKTDDATWQIYSNGLTIGVNQVEQDGSRKKCMTYKPKNISELSAFVAAIRPGFKSMYKRFENREDFKYGIDALDNLVQTEELPVSFLFFQEQCMSVLHYAGFPMDQCYGIIKSIAKKHPEKVLPLKEQFLEGFKKQVMIDENIDETQAEKYSADVWQIINDNVNYSFNSAHAYCMALDSLYQAWQKAHYPYEFYEVLLQHYSDKGNKAKVAALKSEMKKGFNIREGEFCFRNDNRAFLADEDNGVIYSSLASIKNISQKTADTLFELGKHEYIDFIDLLLVLKKKKINSRQLDILVKLNYFKEFGEIDQLLKSIEFFEMFYDKKQLSKEKIELLGISKELAEKFATKETEKLYSGVDMIGLIREYVKYMPYEKTSLAQKAYYQWRYLGYVDIIDPEFQGFVVAMSVNAKYSPRLSIYSLAKGTTMTVKIPKPQFRKNPIEDGDVIHITNQKKKVRVHMTDEGKFEPTEGEYDWWITDYEVIKVNKDR